MTCCDICEWGAGLAVTGIIYDIGQNVVQTYFQQEVVGTPVASKFSTNRVPQRGLC